jgi:hypothetical protein
MRRLVRLVSVPVLVLALLPVQAGSAAACSIPYPSEKVRPYRGMAFVATVAGVRERGPRSVIRLDVRRELAGTVDARRLVIRTGNWSSGGCGVMVPQALRPGQKLLISARGWTFTDGRRDFAYHPLVWERTGGAWRFHREALIGGHLRDAYPPAAKRATTRAEIMDLVRTGRDVPTQGRFVPS